MYVCKIRMCSVKSYILIYFVLCFCGFIFERKFTGMKWGILTDIVLYFEVKLGRKGLKIH